MKSFMRLCSLISLLKLGTIISVTGFLFILYLNIENSVTFSETLSARRLGCWVANSARFDVALPSTENSKQNCTKTLQQLKERNYRKSGVTRNGKELEKSMEEGLKDRVIVFVAIISAPRSILRRNALRRSWLNECKDNGIPCFFFSDNQDVTGAKITRDVYVPLHQEQLLHGDMILAESPGGINFALRYLWILNWANARYKFDYFLRIDDDYFVCMDRLLLELPHRERKKLYWGYVHCTPEGGVRVDEGFVIVSNDLAQQFIREQNKTLMCHPYGDQAMSMWINNIQGVIYFGDNKRVHHGVVSREQIFKNYKDICGNFLAIHGSYAVEVEDFWLNYLSRGKRKNYVIPAITYPCGNMNKTYNWKSFLGMYNAVPRPCKENPIWNIAPFYKGRRG